MDNFTILYETVMSKLPEKVRGEIRKKSVKNTMPDDAFLLPAEKLFPIKSPGKSEYNCKLIYAAYVRATQLSSTNPEYEKIAIQAKQLMKQNDCSKRIKLKLESSLVNDESLKTVLSVINNGDLVKRPISTSKVCMCTNCLSKITVDKNANCDTMVCNKCHEMMSPMPEDDKPAFEGVSKNKSSKIYRCPLCGTKSSINGKCVKCDGIMIPMIENSNSISLDENFLDRNAYACTACETVVSKVVFENEKGICPKCGDMFHILEDKTIYDNSKRFNCVRCNTTTAYDKIVNDTCPVCHGLMIVHAVPKYKKLKGLPTAD